MHFSSPQRDQTYLAPEVAGEDETKDSYLARNLAENRKNSPLPQSCGSCPAALRASVGLYGQQFKREYVCHNVLNFHHRHAPLMQDDDTTTPASADTAESSTQTCSTTIREGNFYSVQKSIITMVLPLFRAAMPYTYVNALRNISPWSSKVWTTYTEDRYL